MTKPKETAPCNSQNQEQVQAYYRNVKPGDAAIIRCTQGYFLEYNIDKISDVNPKRGRVYLEKGDCWGGRAYYTKNGKSCFHPGSQSNLIVPTEEIMMWIKDHPQPVQVYDLEYGITPPGQRDGSSPVALSTMSARQIIFEDD
jgi:hypothetical protein